MPIVEIHRRHYNFRIESVTNTILRRFITHCTGTQDIIKNLSSCGPCGRKSGFSTAAFLLRLSMVLIFIYSVKFILNLHVKLRIFYKERGLS